MPPVLKHIVNHKGFRIGAVVLVVYALLGFLLLPYAVERYLPKYARETLHRQVEIGAVRFNPFLFKFEADDFRSQESDGRPLAAFRHLRVDFELSSLFRWTWTFAEIRLDGLNLLIDKGPKGRLNLVELADSFPPGEKTPTKADNGPVRVLLARLACVDSVLTYSDRTGKTPASVTLKPVDLEFENVATLPDRNGAYTLSAELPQGGTLKLQGALTLHPLMATGKLGIKGFKPAVIRDFLRTGPPVVAPQGSVDLQLGYRISTTAGGMRLAFQDARVQATGLRVTDPGRATPLALDVGTLDSGFDVDIGVGARAMTAVANIRTLDLTKLVLVPIGAREPLATLAECKLEGGKVDTGKHEISIGQVSLREGSTRIERDAQGTTRLFAALADAAAAKPEQTPKAPAEKSAWRFKLDTLHVNAFRVGYADQSLQPALAYDLKDITATLRNLGNDARTPVGFDAGLRVQQGGTLKADGSFAPDGTSANANLKLERIALQPVRSLVARHALLDLKTGAVSAAVVLEYTTDKSGPRLRAKGAASIADLLIDEAVGGDRFLEWKTLTADGIDFESAVASTAESKPESTSGRLTIKDVRLLAPGAKVMVFKDRSVNLGRVFEKGTTAANAATVQAPERTQPKTASAGKPDGAARPFPVRVARVHIEQGVVDYIDQSLVLPFSAQIRDFHGAVTGISSDPASRAKIELNGRVEQYGQAKVRGTLRPFAPKRFTDINTEFHNIDMPPFSPYSATFAGRKIASGKLSLDLEYKINDNALAGDNKILLEKFTLGERVDSPDALDLPLDLAVALLTDARGRIDIAVPVSGDMNKPNFSLRGVIGQAIARMLTRIVTAPFGALGKLLGGAGEQVNAIAFEPGSVQLPPPQQEKLVAVGKALRERPQLKIIVGGRYDLERDGAALRAERVRRALAVELDVKLAPDEDTGPVAFDQAQTQRALEKLLQARAGDKAVDALQARYEKQAGRVVERVNPALALLGQESPDDAFYAALFERLVELQPLAEADLQALARQRAESVAQALVRDAGVDKQRVDIGAVETSKAAARDNMVETALALDVREPAAK